MDRLPPETILQVMGEFDLTDLKNMRLVNKQLAATATPLLFAVLSFYGPHHVEPLASNDRTFPKRAVELGKLHEAIPEILSVASVCKKLIFSPAIYREGFWDDYGTYLQDLLEEPVREDEFEYSPGSDEDEPDYESLYEAAYNKRLARPEEERPRILAAEEEWEVKREEEKASEDKNAAALQQMLGRMSRLEEIEILPWEFAGFGDLSFQSLIQRSFEVDIMRNDISTTVDLLHILASSLRASDRHVEKLRIHQCIPELLQNSPGMQHAFTGLRHLRLDMHQVDSLLEDSSAPQALPSLLKFAQPTLERLELVSGGKWPQLPSTGVHSLNRILADEETGSPLSFPSLQYFHLGSMLVSTPSLIGFIAAQPKVSTLEFSYVYLATTGMGWTSLATQLPEVVTSWTVSGAVGDGPIAGFQPPLGYNWCTEWRPDQNPLPAETGWKGEQVEPLRTRFQRIETT
ncbi:hypothetical protein S40293_10585 [Stachybotrys chartarum IBT 40293]|nr:hypothetical protein S40293_10585 [Stachybotrys chartarum IBT 40293]